MTDTPPDLNEESTAAVAQELREAQMIMNMFPLSTSDAFFTLCALQLAWRHPGLPPNVRDSVRRAGHEIQRQLVGFELLMRIAQAGWNMAFDVPFEAKPKEGEKPVHKPSGT